MPRFGLCCKFAAEPIHFRTATATRMLQYPEEQRSVLLAELCGANAAALSCAIDYCAAHNIGDFRINSQILPLQTHPRLKYALGDLPGGGDIIAAFEQCGVRARELGIRLGFHPDQFVILNSPREDVLLPSIEELRCQADIAELVGADVINIHGGGTYGDKPAALKRLADNIAALPENIRRKLTLENDDRSFTPADLLPICRQTRVPLVYDAHHHRCNPDHGSIADTTRAAMETWDREPLFHISSPRLSWSEAGNHRPHHDYIAPEDFPTEWLDLDITVEVEAKAKELAIARLQQELGSALSRS